MFPFFTFVGLYYANVTACSMRLIYVFVLPILRSVDHATTYEATHRKNVSLHTGTGNY